MENGLCFFRNERSLSRVLVHGGCFVRVEQKSAILVIQHQETLDFIEWVSGSELFIHILTLYLPVKFADILCKHYGPRSGQKMSGLIWIQTVRHSDNILDILFHKS